MWRSAANAAADSASSDIAAGLLLAAADEPGREGAPPPGPAWRAIAAVLRNLRLRVSGGPTREPGELLVPGLPADRLASRRGVDARMLKIWPIMALNLMALAIVEDR
jgi:hypothetical protein